VVEFARNVAGLREAAHAEMAGDAAQAIITRLPCSLVAQQREVTPVPGTLLERICGSQRFAGFHWCHYGFSRRHWPPLVAHGLRIGATAFDAKAEAVEVPEHRFFLATVFQPQLGGFPGHNLHPVIEAFIDSVGSSQPDVF
jgi:CTP synthase (UTP-ammonia lyase)